MAMPPGVLTPYDVPGGMVANRRFPTINSQDIQRAIAEAMVESRDLPAEFDRFLDEVADTVRDLSPVGTGKFRNSIKARRLRNRLDAGALRRGASIGQVYSDDDPEKVAAIEFGTSDTEEFAPFRKAAARFMT